MKKLLLIIISLLSISGQVFAGKVDEITARNLGQSFIKNSSHFQNGKNNTDLQLVYEAKSKKSSLNARSIPETYFYVFGIPGSNGFVIVAGDDNSKPVLGYSYESNFDPVHIPANVAKWLEGYREQIRYIIEHHISATDAIKREWQDINQNSNASRTAGVDPLVQTKWDQSPFYNALCPVDNQSNETTVTGCVATGMAQILKFWNYPANGTGFHSYNHDTYGTLSANFGNTTYNWDAMPVGLTGPNEAVANLMYQLGVSVDMHYGIAADGGSGAYVISSLSPVTSCAEYALKTYFGYQNTLHGIARRDYADTDWKNLMKAELDAGRPVLYAGFGNGGGHCFVNDGYDNSGNFHFNWGWSGQFDGFFAMDALNPGGVGTGGGTGGFNSGHQALIGIQPPPVVPSFDLALYDYVTPSPTEIYYGGAFTITTNIANFGNNAFTGDYCAAVFDNNLNFIDFVETKTGWTLEAVSAYSNNLEFTNSGLISMLPGTYYISIYYRPTGGNWVELPGNGNYVNLATINVINPNAIELNSAIVLDPANSWVKGQPASVNVNIINTGNTTFTGDYSADLYDLDGNWVVNIGTLSENNGLAPGNSYLSPFLTFNTASVDVSPGTYLLAILHQPAGGSYELTGSTNFLNPVYVKVEETPLVADPYENNDDFVHAFEFTPDFINEVASVSTGGSNCHIGSDYDYYKINLDPGFFYSVAARLHDSYNSGNGNTYTLDALLSYSLDGSTLSDSYDDIIPESISINDGGSLYFLVSPYFTGQTGTYLLDLSVTKSALSSISNSTEANMISIYPNPASGLIFIDLSRFPKSVDKIEMVNLSGQAVLTSGINLQNGKILELQLRNLPEDLYILRLNTPQGVVNKKIIVKR